MSLVRGNPFLFSGLWFISCSREENGLPRRFTPRNDRLVLAGRVDFYIVLYCKNGTAQRPSPTIIFMVSSFFSTLLQSPLWRPLRHFVPLPLVGAALRGKNSRLVQLGAASRQRFRTGVVALPPTKNPREALRLPVGSLIYFIEKNASLPRYSAESNSSSSMRSS